MALTDDELFEFDRKPANFKLSDARRTLAGELGDIYRVQLVAARWIEGWRLRTLADDDPMTWPEQVKEGFDLALREVAAHLRQGDLLPGGVLYEDEMSGGPDEARRGK